MITKKLNNGKTLLFSILHNEYRKKYLLKFKYLEEKKWKTHMSECPQGEYETVFISLKGIKKEINKMVNKENNDFWKELEIDIEDLDDVN